MQCNKKQLATKSQNLEKLKVFYASVIIFYLAKERNSMCEKKLEFHILIIVF